VLGAHTINLWRLARDLSLLETVSFANEGLVFFTIQFVRAKSFVVKICTFIVLFF